MKIKTGDNITVLTGKDKGMTGKVVKAFPRDGKILVEGINMRKRHMRATRQGGKGQIIDKAHPIDASNVRKTDGATEKPKKARTVKAKAPAKVEAK